MNVLVVLNTCPHPLDPGAELRAEAGGAGDLARRIRPGPDDLCRMSRPENERGFANTERYFL